MENSSSTRYAIGASHGNGISTIWKFCTDIINQETRNKFPLRVEVIWAYDNDKNNGMPDDVLVKEMVELEKALNELEGRHSVSRTGGNLKELVYYTNDKTPFEIATAVYPAEVESFADPEWDAHEHVLSLFKNAPMANYTKRRPKRIKPFSDFKRRKKRK